jgi:predicted nucleic acid-binding protein
MFLVDTVVLSELTKRRPNRAVAEWMERQRPADLFLSVVTVGEIERGIAMLRPRDAGFAIALTEWLDQVLMLYGSRILPFDLAAARRWGQLSSSIGNKGMDLAIAATALEHGLTVVTRNVAHFAPTGVATLNPFR